MLFYLCAREQFYLGPRRYQIRSWTIGTRIFDALDAADLAWKEQRVDVSKMEDLLGTLLARQLTSFYKAAGGKVPS